MDIMIQHIVLAHDPGCPVRNARIISAADTRAVAESIDDAMIVHPVDHNAHFVMAVRESGNSPRVDVADSAPGYHPAERDAVCGRMIPTHRGALRHDVLARRHLSQSNAAPSFGP